MAKNTKGTRFTYTEAYEKYTEKFTRTETIGGKEETFRPQSVCNHKELDEIFARCTTWDQILHAMRERVGSSYSVRSR